MNLLHKISTITALTLTFTLATYATETPNVNEQALISYTSMEDAKGDVKVVYDEIKAAFGIVPEPIKGLSLNPAMLRAQWEMYKIMGSNPNFSPKLGAMMRMLVAEKNSCTFCVGFNKGMLLNIFKLSEDEVAALQKDPTTAKLPEKEKAMLLFMLKSTTNPHAIHKEDIDALKALGWEEKDIMEGVKSATEMVATSLFIDTFKIQ